MAKRANSPIVRPWRSGTGSIAMNEAYAVSRMGPWIAQPPMGSGRSRTTTRRCDWLDRTGLRWVRPSPNLPDLEAAAWYPGTVLFEPTNLSVGRGTDAPFRQLGAPWLHAGAVARVMRQRYRLALDTVRFTPHAPGDGKFDGVEVRGVRLPAADPVRGDPVRDALRLLRTIAAQHPGLFRVDSLGLARRLGVWPGTAETWPADARRFAAERAPFLLYR